MRNNIDTYKIWAPDKALWTEWAKPVLFANSPLNNDDFTLNVPQIDWISGANNNMIIIVDLPGKQGVEEGLALADMGYRPVPLYNGVDSRKICPAAVDVSDIVNALYDGADMLIKSSIRSDAPPAFLLDANRMKGQRKERGKYDNRWCVFPQDMPSASFIVDRGINNVIIRSDIIRDDLSHVLCRYQEQGIKIYLSTDAALTEKKIAKPSRFKSLAYRFQMILGLTRNSAGGFGSAIPEPIEYNSTVRYYGIG